MTRVIYERAVDWIGNVDIHISPSINIGIFCWMAGKRKLVRNLPTCVPRVLSRAAHSLTSPFSIKYTRFPEIKTWRAARFARAALLNYCWLPSERFTHKVLLGDVCCEKPELAVTSRVTDDTTLITRVYICYRFEHARPQLGTLQRLMQRRRLLELGGSSRSASLHRMRN